MNRSATQERDEGRRTKDEGRRLLSSFVFRLPSGGASHEANARAEQSGAREKSAPDKEGGWDDARVESVMGNLLRVGVLMAAAVVMAGGALFLLRHGTEPTQYQLFRGEPADLRSVTGIISDTFSLSGQGLIQLGLLLLVATPVARVVFSVIAFLRERDLTYVAITLLVLAVLTYSLLGGQL